MAPVHDLLAALAGRREIIVQTHNFPDPDAVATAFALADILQRRGFATRIVYDGTIQRDSLQRMIADLGIAVTPASAASVRSGDPIVIVDGCKGSKNVTDLPGQEIAIVDHHLVTAPEDVPFRDIRSGLGACATLLVTYYGDLDLEIPRRVATALLIGLLTDTDLLQRGVSREDTEAYARLYRLADIPLVNNILRNKIQEKDLGFYRRAIDKVRVEDRIAWCYLEEGCNQNLLGILGDFFLSVAEVDFVLLAARNDARINLSARSERSDWNASLAVQDMLAGIGFGGGHADMAGGIVADAGLFDPDAMRARLGGILTKATAKR